MRFLKKSVVCLLVLLMLLSITAQAAGLNVACPDFRLTSIDGTKVTNDTIAGKTTLLIFSHISGSHGADDSLINTLLAADWLDAPNFNVIVADCMGATVEEVRNAVHSNYGKNTGITFCSGGALWDFISAAGDGSSVSLPASFLIDASGKIRATLLGENSDVAYRQMLSGYVDGIKPIPATTISISGDNVYSEAFKILNLINAQRKENGLSAVKMEKALLDAAMLRAAECAVYYSHTRPDGTRCFTAFPPEGNAKAENIAVGQRGAEEVMTDWMNSSGHRANILTAEFASVGVGVFLHNGVYTWVQLFSSYKGADMTAPADTAKTVKIKVLEEHLVPSVEPMQLMMKQNTTHRIVFSAPNQGFPYQKMLPNSSCLTYRSDNAKVAKVDANGVITAVAPGTAHITVTLNGTEKSVTFPVTVGQHTYVETVEKAPTCAEPGIGIYICEDCGDRKTEEIPKLKNHTWDKGKVTRQPTTEKEGLKTYTCEVCGSTTTKSIPKLSAPKPTPTVPPTAAPTIPATKAPTAAPTVPATKTPTVAPTVPATNAPTQPATPVPSMPTEEQTQPTQPSQLTTEPSETVEKPTQPETQLPTEPLATEPTSATETQLPTQPKTENPAQPAAPQETGNGSKLLIGIVVVAVAILAIGVCIFLRKKKK